MNSIILKANVTEFEVAPDMQQEFVSFKITENALVISILDDTESVLDSTEIDKKDAIELAKLILFKYQ